jgi:hypothetical protein
MEDQSRAKEANRCEVVHCLFTAKSQNTLKLHGICAIGAKKRANEGEVTLPETHLAHLQTHDKWRCSLVPLSLLWSAHLRMEFWWWALPNFIRSCSFLQQLWETENERDSPQILIDKKEPCLVLVMLSLDAKWGLDLYNMHALYTSPPALSLTREFYESLRWGVLDQEVPRFLHKV